MASGKEAAQVWHEFIAGEYGMVTGTDRLINLIEHSMFKEQLELVARDPLRPKRCACCGRRAGKTQAIIRKMFLTCMRRPRSVAVYFATTLASARKLVWDSPFGIPALIHDLGLSDECSINESDHRVTFKNGSVLWVAGCDTMQDARRWKGLYYDVAVLDECQDWPSDILAYMVNEALAYALMDRRGELLLTGTPSSYFAGLFYEVATGVRTGWHVQNWNCFANPHIDDPQGWIEAECRDRGLTLDDPIVQREFFGRWVRDTNSMLYSYQPGRNDYDALPQEMHWRYVLGIDCGIRDLTTYTIAAFRPFDRCVYFPVSYGEKATDETAPITRMAAIVEAYQRRLGMGLQVVGDFGALAKGWQLELQNRFGLNLSASKKQDKPGFIRLMNDQFRLGLIKVGKDCVQLKHQFMTLQVDPKTQIEKPQDPCDYADSALYAWRKCWAYLARPLEDQSEKAQRERMVARILAQRTKERTALLTDEQEVREMQFQPWAPQQGLALDD